MAAINASLQCPVSAFVVKLMHLFGYSIDKEKYLLNLPHQSVKFVKEVIICVLQSHVPLEALHTVHGLY